MARKDFTFVEKTDNDNGYDWLSGALRIGEVDVGSVKELVDHVIKNLGEGDCIGDLTIIGHGCPGDISVGNGTSGSDKNKSIGLFNKKTWMPELKRLRCKFCPDSTVYLRGCNVGADAEGAELLFLLNKLLKCAGSVQAPTGLCDPLMTGGADQRSDKDDAAKPAVIPNPDTKSKQKKKKKKSALKGAVAQGLFSGEDPLQLERCEAIQVVAARYLPRYPGRPYGLDALLNGGARCVSARVVRQLSVDLEDAELESADRAGFAAQGLLQLAVVDDEGGARWLSPYTLTGGGAFLSVLQNSYALVYRLPEALAGALQELHRDSIDALHMATACAEVDPEPVELNPEDVEPVEVEPLPIDPEPIDPIAVEPVEVEPVEVEPEPLSPEDEGAAEVVEPPDMEARVKAIMAVEGVDVGYARRLALAGVTSLDDLARLDPEASAEGIRGISAKRLSLWRAQAELLVAYPRLDSNGAELLVMGLGVKGVIDLQAQVIDLEGLKAAAEAVTLPAGYPLEAVLAAVMG